MKSMKVLIIKMSSLGDVLHALPALTDAKQALPNISFDWVVEEAFADLPKWHPAVDKVIPIGFRRLRKTPIKSLFTKEWRDFKKMLRSTTYDLVIDAQGLIKSALITRLAKGTKAGLDKQSLWEPLARFAYQKHYPVNPQLHAVTRVRHLFAQCLGYPIPETPAQYGVDRESFQQKNTVQGDYLLFLHGTTWDTKLWPENYWLALSSLAGHANFKVLLAWGNAEEKARAERIADLCECAEVLPKMSLNKVVYVLAGAKAIAAVDTGLGHIAAALGVPTVSIYGPTDPKKTGTVGNHQIHLVADFECAPCLQKKCSYMGASDEKPACFTTVSPQQVWDQLKQLMRD